MTQASDKVTFLVYDDFEGRSLPEIRQRIKVKLRTRRVQEFDYLTVAGRRAEAHASAFRLAANSGSRRWMSLCSVRFQLTFWR
jgi:hypothetical protein